MTTPLALRMAEDQGLDLVEVQPQAKPPVCRILDWGKYKYLQAKKASQSSSKEILLKEMKLHPKTAPNDLAFKLNHIRDWLKEGHKVKIVVVYKGREIVHQEFGRNHMDAFLAAIQSENLGVVESASRMEGRNLTAIVAPKKK